VFIVAAAAATSGLLMSNNDPAKSSPLAPTVRSMLLTTAQPLVFDPTLGYYTDGPSAAAAAMSVIQQIPLPRGGRRAIDTDWAAQVRGGGLSRGDIEALLQFRATCDWIQAALAAAARCRDLLTQWAARNCVERAER
jgi:hypothetical protein